MKVLKILLGTLISLFLIGCNSNNEVDAEISESFEVDGAWMRVGSQNRNSAAFMKLINNTKKDDTLFSVNSDLAKVIEIHETFTAENDTKGMRQVDQIIIPAMSSVELRPGGYHVMLIGLNNDISMSDSSEIVLKFKVNGDIMVKVNAK